MITLTFLNQMSCIGSFHFRNLRCIASVTSGVLTTSVYSTSREALLKRQWNED